MAEPTIEERIFASVFDIPIDATNYVARGNDGGDIVAVPFRKVRDDLTLEEIVASLGSRASTHGFAASLCWSARHWVIEAARAHYRPHYLARLQQAEMAIVKAVAAGAR